MPASKAHSRSRRATFAGSRRRGRPSKPDLEIFPGPEPEIPPPPTSYASAAVRFRVVLEVHGRRNEKRSPSRFVFDVELTEAATDWISWAAFERGESFAADVVRLLDAACPKHVNPDDVLRKYADMKAATEIAPWSSAKTSFVLASFYFGRPVFLSEEQWDAIRERAVEEFAILIAAIRVEFAAAKLTRSPRYLKAEQYVLEGRDGPRELRSERPTLPSSLTAENMLKYDLACALHDWAPRAVLESIPDRIERAYVLMVAYDRVRTELRRNPETNTVAPSEWQRIGIDVVLGRGDEIETDESPTSLFRDPLGFVLDEEAAELEALEGDGVSGWSDDEDQESRT